MTNSAVITLNRSEYQWISAESPASFALRYACTMRKFLNATFSSDETSKLILQSSIETLIKEGYGDTEHQLLRNYLIDLISQHAKIFQNRKVLDNSGNPVDPKKLAELKPESIAWMQNWRDGLLERSWRSIERMQHNDPESPIYSVLRASSAQPSADPSMLSVQIAASDALTLTEDQIEDLLAQAKTTFAQILADEISETIADHSRDSILQEIQLLGLNRAFVDIKTEYN